MHISPLPQCVFLVRFRTPKLHSRRKNNFCGWRVRCDPAPTSFIPLLWHFRIVGSDDPSLLLGQPFFKTIPSNLPGRPGRATIPLNVPLVAFAHRSPLLQIHHRGE